MAKSIKIANSKPKNQIIEHGDIISTDNDEHFYLVIRPKKGEHCVKDRLSIVSLNGGSYLCRDIYTDSYLRDLQEVLHPVIKDIKLYKENQININIEVL